MADGFIVRKGGVSSETTAAPTITIVSETGTDVTFTLTNNDDNTAFITFEIDDTLDVIELAAAATSANITVALAEGTYTLSAFATVVGEVASQSSETVVIEVIIIEYEELFSTTVATATTQIDITGLSIGKDDTLRLVYTFVGDSTDANNVSVQVNNITSNYHLQTLGGQATTLTVSRAASNSTIFFGRSNQKTAGFADIKVSNNDRFVCQSQFMETIGSGSSAIRQFNHNIVNTGTVTSITSLKIVSSRTNGIAVGSKIALYKVTEAA